MKLAWILGVLVAGCSSSSSDKALDCAYLAGDNCWKTTAAGAPSCLPASGTSGTLAADNSSCTYASGQTITFTPALTLPLPDNFKDWNFTVTTNGQECLHYDESASGFSLTVSGDTVTETLSGTAGVTLACPDGTAYASSNALALLSCPGSNLGDLPGNATSSSSTSVTFSLISTGTPDTIQVFDCSH